MIQSLFNLIYMTYLFRSKGENVPNTTLEVGLDIHNGFLGVAINRDGEIVDAVNLDRKDLYHLIGALHLIQKEMKEANNG